MNLYQGLKRLANDIVKCNDPFYQYARHPERRFKVDSVYTFQDNLIDIPYEVVTSKEDFVKWSVETKRNQQLISDRIPLSRPISFDLIKKYENAFGTIEEYRLVWQNDNPLHGSVFGGSIGIPAKYDKNKPLIIFIHGHGMVRNFSGEYRSDLFQSDGLANEVIGRGYAVWAPDNVFHDELMELHKEHDYSDMWAKVINHSWEMVRSILPKTKKCYIIGLAAGGTTGLSLALINKEISGLVTSGVFFPLDLTRRDYRIKNHPLCHDFRHYASYLPLYAMALDRPLQIQMGKHDGLWAGNINRPSRIYKGLKRPVLTEESLGALYILEKLSGNLGAKFSFRLTQKGHERLDFDEAFSFISTIEK